MKRFFLFTLSFVLAFELNSLAQTWTQVANYGGTAVYGSFSFAIGNKGYVGTGSNLSGYYQEFWEYDATLDTWTQKANVPGNARYAGIAFAIGNFGYAGTGYSVSTPAMSDMYKYDPSQNTWTAIASIPVARVSGTAFSIGQKGYVLIGDHTSNQGNNPSNDVWEFNPVNDSWTAKTSLPATPRGGACGFAVGGKGYVGGGTNGSNTLSDFWEYDPQLDSWTQRTNIPIAICANMGLAIGNRGFIINGYTTTNSDQVYEYDPILDTWTARPYYGGGPRYGSAAFAIGSVGYVGGGRANSTIFSDWWKYTDPALSVDEEGINLSVEIYPNPVAETARILIPADVRGNQFTFKVFNLQGECVHSETISRDAQFSPKDLAAGAYLYKISTDEGDISSGKLVIQ